jgi:hypothetical protein
VNSFDVNNPGLRAQHQLTIDMSGRRLDTILVGIGSNDPTQPIAFRLTVDPAESK